MPLPWNQAAARAAAVASVACLVLAAYITQQAAQSEQKIIRATKLALAVTQSGDVNNPRWNRTKTELLRLIREGVAINPHYRKITPMVADELARWGDWRNAIWIWESVLSSRPYIVVLMSNIARGYASTGEPQKALEYLERARTIRPDAPSVRSLEVILLTRTGDTARALALARDAVHHGVADYDMLRATTVLASRGGDFPLAVRAFDLLAQGWPQSRPSAYLELGNLYGKEMNDPAKALDAYRKALEATEPADRPALQAQIPAAAWKQLAPATSIPATTTQISVISK